jgi:hypothetical protein
MIDSLARDLNARMAMNLGKRRVCVEHKVADALNSVRRQSRCHDHNTLQRQISGYTNNMIFGDILTILQCCTGAVYNHAILAVFWLKLRRDAGTMSA